MWVLHCLTCIASPIERSLDGSTLLELASIQPVQRTSYQQLATTRRTPNDKDPGTSDHFESRRRHHDTLTEYHAGTQVSKRGSGGSVALRPKGGLSGFDLQTKSFQHFGMILPMTEAAKYLIQFLDTVALYIETGSWADSPPTNHRVIRMWDFELTFYSLHANIPWDFVQAYVLDIQADIQKGFTGVYDEHLVGIINGVAAGISVRLRLARNEAPTVLTR
ncbi:MAG: hypothetical protein Q9166_006203 [cf. Caloplaca sp. 2 TL-2023]